MTFDADEIEAGRKLFAGPCDFMLGVAGLEQLPADTLPEIALAGRSNVGKSSLVNALTGRKMLAKTSHTPGRTQQLNYFNLGGKLFIVDMPGYGYAKVSKTQKEEWNELIRAYFRGRAGLRCVFILIDSRHGLKETDEEIMTMLNETGVAYRIVLTKVDKVKTPEQEKVSADIQNALRKRAAAFPEIYATSSHDGIGIAELRAALTSFTS
jgi:GTP-binding protein